MVRRASIIAVQQKDERQRLRRKLGTLELNLVKRITVERYTEAFNLFTEYLQQTRGNWPTQPAEYDLLVSEYLEVLWDQGETKSVATYTLAALHYYIPQLKRGLPRSWKLKAIWDKLELPCQAVPLSLDLLFSLVGHFFKEKQATMGLSSLVAFNCLLRTGELLQLLVSDCHRTSSGYVLVLHQTKGAQRRLTQDETVMVSDPLTIWALDCLVANKLPGDFVVGFSGAAFRTRWNKMKIKLLLSNYKFLPYSLRRGGATWYFKSTGSFSQTMARGRWQHLKTCKLYIAEAQTALTALALPPATLRLLDACHSYIRPHLSTWASLGRVEANLH